MRILERITIRNFKSIREQTLELERLNVFIGANGSGKSNLIEVFRFLTEIVDQRLADYTARRGGADVLLHYGRKASRFLEIELDFVEANTANGYSVTLIPTDDDRLAVRLEHLRFHDRSKYERPYEKSVGGNGPESALKTFPDEMSRYVFVDLVSYWAYHFHDTSETAKVKGTCDLEDNRVFRPDAGNLAAFLYYLREKKPDHFANIQETVRQIAPFFDGFNLAPSRLNPDKIRLEWKERGSDGYFNASSLSDGTLRFMCLATLLLQPELPAVVLLDEPELGLHPAAVTLLANLLETAATRTQVVVATQSVTLVNQFAPEKVWAVDREGGQSVFRHLGQEDMAGWLEDYALGELWEKNVLGARP